MSSFGKAYKIQFLIRIKLYLIFIKEISDLQST